jgi:hypothetical protein
MSEIATASINNLRISEADFVSPSEQSITIPAAALQDLLRAVQGLKDEVEALREERGDRDREEIATLRRKMASLESLQEQDTTRILVDIATDRRRLAVLEHPIKEPGKTETSRAEKIEKYLQSRPDHRATYETLKGHLGIDKNRLNEAIKALMASSPGRYGIIRAPGDKRKRTLIMF